MAAIEAIAESAPAVRRSCLNRFHLALFTSILQHIISTRALSDTMHYTPRFCTHVGKLAALIQSAVMSNKWTAGEASIVSLLTQLIKQVVDNTGNIFAFAEAAHGAAIVRSTVDSLFKCINKVSLLLISRTQSSTEAQHDAHMCVLDEMSVLYMDANKDPEVIACLVHCAITLIESSEPVLRDDGFRLWRLLLRFRMKDMVSFCASPMALQSNVASLSGDDFAMKVAELRFQVEEGINKHWAVFTSAKTRTQSVNQSWFARRAGQEAKRAKKLKSDSSALLELKAAQLLSLQQEHAHYNKRLRRLHHKLLDERRLIASEWKHIEAELHRERGVSDIQATDQAYIALCCGLSYQNEAFYYSSAAHITQAYGDRRCPTPWTSGSLTRSRGRAACASG
jgi:hypothetical protein